MISMTPEDVTRRLLQVSDMTDLTGGRIDTKIDMSPLAISARLREVSDLLDACLMLRAARPR